MTNPRPLCISEINDRVDEVIEQLVKDDNASINDCPFNTYEIWDEVERKSFLIALLLADDKTDAAITNAKFLISEFKQRVAEMIEERETTQDDFSPDGEDLAKAKDYIQRQQFTR